MIHVSQARLVGEMPLHIPHHRGVPVQATIQLNHQGHVLIEFDDIDFVTQICQRGFAGQLTHLELAYGHASEATELCHCGRLVAYGYDGDPSHHRGMCGDCDAARCDVDPTNCPYREEG